jgi:glycerol kinase
MTSILALDQGTTSSRALLVHQDGTILGQGQQEFPQHFPEPGRVEHDPEDLYRTTVEAARSALAAAPGERPAAIGITNQRETVVLWDRRTLEPIGPAIVWQDRRTSARCAELKGEGAEPAIRARTGLVLDPYFSATKLEWLLADPALRARAVRGEVAFGTVESWLVARLTQGRVHVTDPTNASRTLLYGLGSGRWEPELLETFGVPEAILPAIVPSSGVVGESDPSVLGHAIPIASLVGDQQSALFGQGCVEPGMAKNTYGTGAFLLLYTGAEPPAPPAGLLATAVCDRHGRLAHGLEGSVFIAGAAVQWLRDGIGLVANAVETARLAESVADTGGVHFVPAFVGLGSPHWNPEARGTITGITRGTTRAHLVRAALEAIAFSTRDLIEGMLTGTGLELPELRVDGGAAGNDWLLQFQADLLGVPVERPDCVETTALGAAALAGLAVGVWPNLDAFLSTRRFRTFHPRVDASTRAAWVAGWDRAVSTALYWAGAR